MMRRKGEKMVKGTKLDPLNGWKIFFFRMRKNKLLYILFLYKPMYKTVFFLY